jgi:DNA-binding response OmpR family regulator
MNESNGKKILIVEDEKSLRKALHDKMSYEGFGVLESSDGEAGLSTALATHPDLILLDIIMPKMDGLTMLKKLREDAWGTTVPVIMLTNLSDGAKIAESQKSNVLDYLVKTDWSLEYVVDKVKENLHM